LMDLSHHQVKMWMDLSYCRVKMWMDVSPGENVDRHLLRWTH
jgi:hypothetical protein